jgi:hypothetical protein
MFYANYFSLITDLTGRKNGDIYLSKQYEKASSSV